ncbi:MAG: SDR family NAD(P)-dependent oxidoreductase [Lactobacillus sp.]|jgi:nucleoside-diphosphate-sugar epimerase|uniref:SDR family NAD(P)-dependent oxidoreductase n=1 Tax=Lacticaseibacillus suilingensis TaxID=2799577 RepID=A0ABW4BDQ1_9LACO|nr:SDR family NAD(P)-dependent oxidoreductase [Lacticaseibacillus suilingensis]MCI1893515.1 SDR family NAD(P)-dependent oxidoreductase [Lactobacillus sp.]MCI1916815.1 SDR family NAD(P)-dependent oxidoreductase [Lactobacillus sp.]MCI1940978.1 SDR family NAD(P)-dependent oxidoreductase [Lactobacillus sp.]MCI1971549.1 SDR family NAD(P)-dependent oxidoreductase [Lactobacillus sp.]MCI2016046.1 SDR family NAD(P)-dependent oxidoreductase [Lactobacillus sp.]
MIKKVLVTGGNGFLGMQLIAQLLNHGATVRATLRSLEQAAAVKQTLAANQVQHLDQLSFIAADLTHDTNWTEAMANIDGVYAVAAPVFVAGASDAALAHEAEAGTLRILKAANLAGVKRVVMTGNWGAIGYSNHDRTRVTTEADWTDPAEPGLSPYEKSKLLAEKAAWQFAAAHPGQPELAVVNPVAMLGQSLNGHVSGSFGLVAGMLDGKHRPLANVPVNVVDVVDVATLHRLAMTQPAAAGHRFIASANGQITLPEIAALIRQQRPALAAKLPTRTLPDWLVKTLAPFSARAKEGRLMLMTNRHTSTAAAQSLGWQPQYTTEATILRTVDQLTK